MAEIIILGNEKKRENVTPDVYIDGLCCIFNKVCRKENPNTIGLGTDWWKTLQESLRMTRRLGHGQFGEVWQGVWNCNTPVAVKTLKEGTMPPAAFLAKANVMKKVGNESSVQLDAVCSYRTCSNKYPVMKHIYKWMLLIYLLFRTTTTVSAYNVKVELKPYRYVSIATNETIAATDPFRQAQSYLIFASSGNHPRSYECTLDFVENNQNCLIVVGSKDKTECEGLQIYENGTHIHLIVNGSKLIHDQIRFCIYQQVPGNFSLYPLTVFKEHDQAPETNHYEVAFYILLGIDVFILLVIAIVIKKNFPCIRAWWKKYIMKQEPTDDTETGPSSSTVGTPMLSIPVAHEHRDE